MTADKAREKAEEMLREIGVEQYATLEERYAQQRDALARALLLAQAEVYESIPHDWHDMPLMDFVERRAAALRRAAEEMK